jgi:hypothetical protein
MSWPYILGPQTNNDRPGARMLTRRFPTSTQNARGLVLGLVRIPGNSKCAQAQASYVAGPRTPPAPPRPTRPAGLDATPTLVSYRPLAH